MTDECRSTQLIDRDGVFNVAGVDNFTKTIKLGECGVSYAVVSIMGPQSSGKSTLLNHLFRTNFREMDASRGISQTTKGIWLAKCAEIEPCTIVMDLEGTDGRERGEDDTAFEKQSALFALAVSDIVLINMWCHDIGREQAANRPLLKTVFQAMMRLFSTRKTTLLFVIRDKRRTPLEKLESILREDIQEIWDSVPKPQADWDSVPKPQAHKETPLSNFFNVEVVALSSYEEKEEQFKEQVASLRQRFFHSIAPGGFAGDRRGVVPASEFSFSAQQIWKIIKQNKDLDLPAHKVMVATVRCEEIVNEKLAEFAGDKNWLQFMESAQVGAVYNFGKKLCSLLDKYLSGYDMEATYFDDPVRTDKLQQLESKLLQYVHPVFQSVLGHLRSKALNDFKASLDNALGRGADFAVVAPDYIKYFMTSFDEGSKDAAIAQAKWDSSEVRENLRRDIDAHVVSINAAKVAKLTSELEGLKNQLKKAQDEAKPPQEAPRRDNNWIPTAMAVPGMLSSVANLIHTAKFDEGASTSHASTSDGATCGALTSHASTSDGATWGASTSDGATWDASTCDGATWGASNSDGATWGALTSHASTCDGATWDASTCDGATWGASNSDGATWDASTSDGATWDASTSDGATWDTCLD